MKNMAKTVEKIQTGWKIPVTCKDSFTKFCDEVGSLVQEDCAGALLIWQYLPAQIRELAKMHAKGVTKIDKKFWDQFRQGLELGIQAQSNTPPQKPDKT
jgi:hypothetical protein